MTTPADNVPRPPSSPSTLMPSSADYPGCPITVIEALERGAVLRAPRWGLGSAAITLVGAIVLGVLAAVPLIALDAPLAVTAIVGTLFPWMALAGWPLFVTRWKGNGPRIDLGLRMTWSDTGW